MNFGIKIVYKVIGIPVSIVPWSVFFSLAILSEMVFLLSNSSEPELYNLFSQILYYFQ